MIELDLEVLWLTDDLKPIQEAGMEVPLKDCTTKTHTFYVITLIRPHNDPLYCELFCSGDIFIINEPYESVRQKIKNQMNFKWN